MLNKAPSPLIGYAPVIRGPLAWFSLQDVVGSDETQPTKVDRDREAFRVVYVRLPFEHRLELWPNKSQETSSNVVGVADTEVVRLPMHLLCDDEIQIVFSFLSCEDLFRLTSVSRRYRRLTEADFLWEHELQDPRRMYLALLKRLGWHWRKAWIEREERWAETDEEASEDKASARTIFALEHDDFFASVLRSVGKDYERRCLGFRPSWKSGKTAIFGYPVPTFACTRDEWIARMNAPFDLARDTRPGFYERIQRRERDGKRDAYFRTCPSISTIIYHLVCIAGFPLLAFLLLLAALICLVVDSISSSETVQILVVGLAAASVLLVGCSVGTAFVLHECIIPSVYARRVERARRLASLIPHEILETSYHYWTSNPTVQRLRGFRWTFGSRINMIASNYFLLGSRILILVSLLGTCCAIPALVCSIGASFFIQEYSLLLMVVFFLFVVGMLFSFHLLNRRHDPMRWTQGWSLNRMFLILFGFVIFPVWLFSFFGLLGGVLRARVGPSIVTFGGVFSFLLLLVILWGVFCFPTFLRIFFNNRDDVCPCCPPMHRLCIFVGDVLTWSCGRKEEEVAKDRLSYGDDSAWVMSTCCVVVAFPIFLVPGFVGAILYFFSVPVWAASILVLPFPLCACVVWVCTYAGVHWDDRYQAC